MDDRAIPEVDLTLTEGGAAAARGEWAAAEEAFRRAHDVAAAHGARVPAAVALSNAGQAALRRGALGDADALLTRALEARASLVQAGLARGAVLARAIGDLAVVRHARGAATEAAELLARAAESARDGDPALAEAYRRDLASLGRDADADRAADSATAPSPEDGAVRVAIVASADVEELAITTVDPTPDATDVPLLDLDDAPAASPTAPAHAVLGLPMLEVEEPVPEPAPPAGPEPDDRLAPLDLELDESFGAADVAAESVGSDPGRPSLDALTLMDVGEALDLEPAPASLDEPPALGFEPTVPVDETPATALPALDLDETLVQAGGGGAATVSASAPAGLEQLALEEPDAARVAHAEVSGQPPDGWAPDPQIAGLAVREAVARESAVVEELLAPTDRTSVATHGFDLDAMELAGASGASGPASPPASRGRAVASDVEDLSFLRTPAGGVSAVAAAPSSGSRADEPIEDVLAALDVELGLAQAQPAPAPVASAAVASAAVRTPLAPPAPDSTRRPLAGPAPDSSRRPLAPPAPDAPRRDEPAAEKSSWWRRLKESTRR